MKEINLIKILDSICKDENKINYPIKSYILQAMKESCEQTLKLAAENVTTMIAQDTYRGNTGSEYPPDIIINKKSILNLKNQIKI